ncbi:glycosyltransferase family 2 protein [Hymenobacter terrestris]|uniref:Glycosyltransferase family 2 protein n=1 Tax=Hymenobacter terrestris TaxID=2748310 RepID=A0ABX2Q560_9BACT|nr:glycosyltransferase family 2 protein [Hymenobacter terrestris]NVO86110.1 glycosyltransferase family 2 protein [Hymenobacter terrestris]
MLGNSSTTNKAGPELSIIIVNMNHLNKLKNLFNSLFGKEKTARTHEIIVVDNCSTDGSVAYIAANYPSVIIHQNDKVRGFAANNNQGVNISSGQYIFICNPDVIVLPGAIDEMLGFYERNPGVGIVCPQLLNSDLTFQPSVRRFYSLKVVALRVLTWGNDASTNKDIRKYLMLDFDKSKIQFIDWALGAAMVLKRSVYQKLGGFDEKFFLYIEDADLCLRCWAAGHAVVYCPQAVCIHDHQRASMKGVNKLLWFHVKSITYFFYKHQLLWRQAQGFEQL